MYVNADKYYCAHCFIIEPGIPSYPAAKFLRENKTFNTSGFNIRHRKCVSICYNIRKRINIGMDLVCKIYPIYEIISF